jgi:phosphatidylserine decarboxylase
MLYLSLSILILFLLVYLYWRFFFFFRDPERNIPIGNNIVSPADGTVVYIKELKNDIVPISVKNKKEILLNEILKYPDSVKHPSYLVGIFMHPTSVHVNRAPLDGQIEKVIYTKNKNLPMTLMWWRVLLRLKPYESYSKHIYQNERNTFLIRGIIPVFVVQIADIYVNKIECWVKERQLVRKGERLGMIKMGSQVDMLFPVLGVDKILVVVGQKVRAGESVIASLK